MDELQIATCYDDKIRKKIQGFTERKKNEINK